MKNFFSNGIQLLTVLCFKKKQQNTILFYSNLLTFQTIDGFLWQMWWQFGFILKVFFFKLSCIHRTVTYSKLYFYTSLWNIILSNIYDQREYIIMNSLYYFKIHYFFRSFLYLNAVFPSPKTYKFHPSRYWMVLRRTNEKTSEKSLRFSFKFVKSFKTRFKKF